MLIKFLRNLQSKPKNVRNNYAFGIATSFTGLVALVWFMGTVNQSALTGAEVTVNEEGTLFSNLIKQSKEQLANLKSVTKTEDNDSSAGDDSVRTEEDTRNPLNITLSQEDISTANENNPVVSQGYVATNIINSQGTTTINTFFGTTEPTYREVQIATTSSTSTKNQAIESTTTSGVGI
jgi:hypothetical protein